MRREATLIPRFSGGPYGPGDKVEGVLVAREPEEQLRTLNGYLKYVDRSPSFSGAEVYDSAEPLHEGPIEEGAEIPFSLRMPEDAYPNWKDPSTADVGTLTWSIVLEADIASGFDTIETHDIPIESDGAAWKGPAPLGEQKVDRLVDDWDVEVTPDPWVLRRGEEVTVNVRIGKPKGERPKLKLGVLCQAIYKVETRDPGESAKTEIFRKDMFEEWPAFDPSLPEQSFTVRVPEDAPFTYRGDAFGFSWYALAVEKRRFYQSDAGREAILEVLP